MLQELKDNFISDLNSTVSAIESLVIDLESSTDFAVSFKELYRRVHSLKGNGGCYGFSIITHICHGLETVLNQIESQQYKVHNGDIDTCLTYIDLLKRTDHALSHGHSLDAISDEFRNLQSAIDQHQSLNCMVIDKSSAVIKLYQAALGDHELNLTHVENSIAALDLIQFCRYDVVICSYEAGLLNGMALVAALKMSLPNTKMKSIVITSSKAMVETHNPALAPDYVIKKGRNTAAEIKAIFAEITAA